MIACLCEDEYEIAFLNEARLMEASRSFNDMAIEKIMKEIVPEYKSKCSKYGVLDRHQNSFEYNLLIYDTIL